MENRFGIRAGRVCLWLLLIYLFECTVGGSGRWLSVGPLSIRMILFALCFVATLPEVWLQRKDLLKNPLIWLTLLFGVYILFSAFLGWKNGNRLGFIWGDISGFLPLALLPGGIAVFSKEENWKKGLLAIYLGALLVGVVTTVLHFWFAFAPQIHVHYVNTWLNDHAMGGMALMETGLHRVYIRSQIFLQVGILLGIYFAGKAKGIWRILCFLAEGVLLFACLISYTRGFWLGLAVSAAVLLVLQPCHWRTYFTAALVSLGVTAVLFLASWGSFGRPIALIELAGRFDPSLIQQAPASPQSPDGGQTEPVGETTQPVQPTEPPQSTEPTQPPSVDENNTDALALRQQTLVLHRQKIGENPILGSGLGTNLDGIREDGKTEYMYLDMLMKLGGVGFVLFLLVFFWPAGVQLGRRWRQIPSAIPFTAPAMGVLTLLCSYIGVAVTSGLNPFLTNPMGIMMLMILAAGSCMKNNEVKER